MNYKKKLLIKVIGVTLLTCASAAQAANWLMLQGTEPEGQSARAKVWGFIQAQYQDDNSDAFVNGSGVELYNPPKLVGPNLDSQSQFNVNRARIGIRGTGFPLDSKVNYFILAELGNNGITAGADGKHLTDASITLNYIPGARVRMGLFKTPGAEEGLQAIHVFDYINFTTATNQLLLERFPSLSLNCTNVAIDPIAAEDPTDPPITTVTNCTQAVVNQGASTIPNANMNQYSRAVGAFRDVGIQIFDTFKVNKWEHSYAIMLGNGNGLNYGDNDDNKDLYLYWSSELVFGGKGGRRQGLKLFAWNQDGKRTNVADKTQEQDRKRTGLGVKYLQRPFRISAEYMEGEGMIFQGPHRPGHIFNDGEAEGFYVEGGWYIPNTNFEIDLRYDEYTRDELHPKFSAAGDETTFETVTLGAQYHFNKKTRLNIEYSDRTNESDTTQINNQQKDVDGRFAVQVTHIF